MENPMKKKSDLSINRFQRSFSPLFFFNRWCDSVFLQFTTLRINQLYVSNSSVIVGWLFFRTAEFGCRELGPETWVHRNSPGRVRIYGSYFISAIVFGHLNILFYNPYSSSLFLCWAAVAIVAARIPNAIIRHERMAKHSMTRWFCAATMTCAMVTIKSGFIQI